MEIKCPKCRQKPTAFIEIHSYMSVYYAEDGKPDLSYHVDEPGLPECVKARCACGHIWRLRRVNQITDLVED